MAEKEIDEVKETTVNEESKEVKAETKPAEETKAVKAENKTEDSKETAAKKTAAKESAPKKAAAAKSEKAKKPAKAEKETKAVKSSKSGKAAGPTVIPNVRKLYLEEVVPSLQKEFNYKSYMQIPKVEKVIISAGVGEAINNKKLMEAAVNEMSIITGQKAVKTKARKSIAGFKIREGMEIGVKVTLRGSKMYEFLDRLINVALPRVKDFRGVNPKAFDGKGNYSLGIKEQIIFPEIDYDKIEQVSGLNVAIVTTAETDDEARSMLKQLGMPFSK